MRLGRPNHSRNWVRRYKFANFNWDELVRTGRVRFSPSLRSAVVQLRSGDVKGTGDFNIAKMGLFLEELLAFHPTADDRQLHRPSKNIKKLRRAMAMGRGPARQDFFFRFRYSGSTELFYLWQYLFDRLHRFVKRKQLPLRFLAVGQQAFTYEVQELTPFLSGSESLYLTHDYFDWEDVQLHFIFHARSDYPWRSYLSAFKFTNN